MRRGTQWTCPSCNDTFAGRAPAGIHCDRCDVGMEDERGSSAVTTFVSVVPPQSETAQTLARWGSWMLAAGVGVGSLAAVIAWALVTDPFNEELGAGIFNLGPLQVAVVALATRWLMKRLRFDAWVRGRFDLRTAKATLAAIDEELEKTPRSGIGDAPPGQARIRGRVRVLQGLAGASTLAARTGHIGRFAVVDETGMAIIDDDMVELWPSDVGEFAAVDLLDGDLVEVTGRARRGHAREATPGDYRGGSNALLFDGTPEAKIHVRKLPPEADPPKVRAGPPEAMKPEAMTHESMAHEATSEAEQRALAEQEVEPEQDMGSRRS